ncbi:unnamed protein product, partial [Protopolystoma xenopodis]
MSSCDNPLVPTSAVTRNMTSRPPARRLFDRLENNQFANPLSSPQRRIILTQTCAKEAIEACHQSAERFRRHFQFDVNENKPIIGLGETAYDLEDWENQIDGQRPTIQTDCPAEEHLNIGLQDCTSHSNSNSSTCSSSSLRWNWQLLDCREDYVPTFYHSLELISSACRQTNSSHLGIYASQTSLPGHLPCRSDPPELAAPRLPKTPRKSLSDPRLSFPTPISNPAPVDPVAEQLFAQSRVTHDSLQAPKAKSPAEPVKPLRENTPSAESTPSDAVKRQSPCRPVVTRCQGILQAWGRCGRIRRASCSEFRGRAADGGLGSGVWKLRDHSVAECIASATSTATAPSSTSTSARKNRVSRGLRRSSCRMVPASRAGQSPESAVCRRLVWHSGWSPLTGRLFGSPHTNMRTQTPVGSPSSSAGRPSPHPTAVSPARRLVLFHLRQPRARPRPRPLLAPSPPPPPPPPSPCTPCLVSPPRKPMLRQSLLPFSTSCAVDEATSPLHRMYLASLDLSPRRRPLASANPLRTGRHSRQDSLSAKMDFAPRLASRHLLSPPPPFARAFAAADHLQIGTGPSWTSSRSGQSGAVCRTPEQSPRRRLLQSTPKLELQVRLTPSDDETDPSEGTEDGRSSMLFGRASSLYMS